MLRFVSRNRNYLEYGAFWEITNPKTPQSSKPRWNVRYKFLIVCFLSTYAAKHEFTRRDVLYIAMQMPWRDKLRFFRYSPVVLDDQARPPSHPPQAPLPPNQLPIRSAPCLGRSELGFRHRRHRHQLSVEWWSDNRKERATG